MKKSAAIELYLFSNPCALKIVNRIMAWNPKLSCGRNAERLEGLSVENARFFAKRYKLGFIPGKLGQCDPKIGFWKFHIAKNNGGKK